MAPNLPFELYRPILRSAARSVDTLRALSLTSKFWCAEADRVLFFTYSIGGSDLRVIVACQRIINSPRLQRCIRQVVLNPLLPSAFLGPLSKVITRALRSLSSLRSLEVTLPPSLSHVLSWLGKDVTHKQLSRFSWLRPIIDGNVLSFLRAHPSISTLELPYYRPPLTTEPPLQNMIEPQCEVSTSFLDPHFLPHLETFSGTGQLGLCLLFGPCERPISRLELIAQRADDGALSSATWDALDEHFRAFRGTLRALYISETNYLHRATMSTIRRLSAIPGLQLNVLGRCYIEKAEEEEFIHVISKMPTVETLSIWALNDGYTRGGHIQLDFAERLRAGNANIRNIRYNLSIYAHSWVEWEFIDGDWQVRCVSNKDVSRAEVWRSERFLWRMNWK